MTILFEKINFGNIIEEKRIAAGLSKKRLSILSGVCQATLSCLAKGYYKTPDITTLMKLAKAFEITLEELIYGEKQIIKLNNIFCGTDKLTKIQIDIIQGIINEFIKINNEAAD